MSSAQGSSRAASVSSSRPANSKPPSVKSQDGLKKSPLLGPEQDQRGQQQQQQQHALQQQQQGQGREAVNGRPPTPAPAAGADGTSGDQPNAKYAERTSMKEKLTRMFSSKDTPKTTPPSTGHATPQPHSADDNASHQQQQQQPPLNQAQHAPPSRTPSRTPSSTAVAEKTEKTEKSSKPDKKDSQRFESDSSVDGGHLHHLRAARRQEKLSDLWRLFIGKKQDRDLDHDENLSLFYNWVDATKAENRRQAVSAEKKEGPNTPASLTQKYGKCQEVVGRGAFGVVRISHKKVENGQERLFAVKEFRRRPEETEKRYSKRLTAEFCISSSLRHPNVIHTLDLLKDAKGDYCEVMEFCAGGDLFTLVLAAGKLEVQEADCFFKQMMRGVQYLHDMGVAHRDLKPENLLLTTRGALKITDFGNGECFRMAWETDAHMVTGLCGSAPYIAPEEYTDKEFDARAVDVWACGVIYMAMRTGRHLWRTARSDQDEFYQRYLTGRRDEAGFAPIESLHRARCRNVIYSILDPNPTRRITAAQVLKSEWGREIKVCKAGEEGI